MRLLLLKTTLLICSFLGSVCLQAQTLLSGQFQDVWLAEAIKTLEKNYDIRVSYDPALLEGVRVQARFQKKKVAEAFDILLRETPLTADVLQDKFVVLRRRGKEADPPEQTLVCGRVLDESTGEPLPFAAILVQGRPGVVNTSEDGRFQIKVLSASLPQDSLQVRYLGYEIRRFALHTLAKKPCADIRLPQSSNQLVEIVVTDRAVDPLGAQAYGENKQAMYTDRTGFVPGLGEPDPLRMAQFLPGISAPGDKAGELLVRGGSHDQNLVLWEGIPIYHTGHLFGLVSALNPYVVNQVNVWKGNFGVEYGGRASSLIDLRSRPKPLDRPVFSFGSNLVSAYFSFETPVFQQKGGLMLAGRSAFSNVMENPFYQKLFGYATQDSRINNDRQTQQSDSSLLHAIQIQPTSEFSDANLKFYYQFNEKTRLDISAYGGIDVLRYRVDANVPDWNFYFSGRDTVAQINVGAGARLQQRWTNRYATEWQIAWSAYNSAYGFAGSFDTIISRQIVRQQDNNINEVVFRFDNTWQISDWHQLRFGVQSLRTANGFSERYADLSQPDNRNEWSIKLPSNQSAIYGAWRAGDQKNWFVELGIRHVTFNYTIESLWEPRFSAQWSPVEHIRLKLNGGVFRQFMRKVYIWNELGLNNEVWMTADENLRLPILTNRQVSLGAAFEQDDWLFDLEVYSKTLQALSGVNLRFNGAPEQVWDARGTELANGAELLFRKRWGRYTHWLSYTYSLSLARFDSLNAGNAFPTDFDQRNTLNWAHHFNWKKWTLAIAWLTHSGRPYTPPAGIREWTDSNGNIQREISYGPRNTARLPDYHRLDLSLQYHFGKKRLRGSVGFSVFNLYNRINTQSRQFFVETTRNADGTPQYGISALERTSLGRMTNLFVLVKF